LIAAHGALWASRYFKFGIWLGRCLSLPHAVRPVRRAELLIGLSEFADAFREVNRYVCVDTYTLYHFTARYGDHPQATDFVPVDLLEALNQMHLASREGRSMSVAEKREIFETFLAYEQRTIVGPSVQQAVADFDWPLLKFIALRPVIRFAYFPKRRRIWFRNFADVNERIRNGLNAFDFAAAVGLAHVESALSHYEVLPAAFFCDSEQCFANLRAEEYATR
jgi:hypothetical protein